MGQLAEQQRTEDRILFQLKTRGPRAAAEIGARLGMTSVGARQHLAKLAAAGLVESEDQRHGRGRPRKHWRLTDAGHARFPDRHSDLTVELLSATRSVFGEAGLAKLVRHRERQSLAAYARQLAGRRSLRGKLDLLAAIRSSEGYMATVTAEGWRGYLFVENHCPICAAAATCQGLCRSEIAIFRAVLGKDVRVTRTDHILAGARRCAYRVELIEE
jgi:predicted ArsR family transcriptional regulator